MICRIKKSIQWFSLEVVDIPYQNKFSWRQQLKKRRIQTVLQRHGDIPILSNIWIADIDRDNRCINWCIAGYENAIGSVDRHEGIDNRGVVVDVADTDVKKHYILAFPWNFEFQLIERCRFPVQTTLDF